MIDWPSIFAVQRTVLKVAAFGLTLLLFAPASVAQEPAKDPFDVFSVAVSKDGRFVAGGGGMWDRPGEIGVWELATRKPLRRFTEDHGIASVAFSPNGKLLASGSWNGHVRVRDWAAGKAVADFEVDGVARVAFSPNGELLATATEHQTVQLWDMVNYRLLANLKGDLFRFHYVTFSPDGKRLLAGGGDWKQGGLNQVTIWDVANKQQVLKLTGHQNAIICIAFSPDGKTIATGGVDKTIRLWDADSGTTRKTMSGHQHWVESLVFLPDGKTLVSASHDHTIRFWDVDEGKEKSQIVMPSDARVVCLSPDGQLLLGGGAQKTLKVFEATSHKEVGLLWNGSDRHNVDIDDLPITFAETVEPEEPSTLAALKEARTSWLIAAEILAVVFTIALLLALGVWLYLRRSRSAENSPGVQNNRSEPETAAGPVSFSCAACGKTLKAKVELAGKKVRCSQCGLAVLVPAIQADEAGHVSL